MRYLLIVCFFFSGFLQNQLKAQAAQDIVLLNNGQTHQGIVIEQKPGEHIRLLRLPERDTLKFGMEEIDRIIKILPTSPPPATDTSTAPTVPERRFNTNKVFTFISYYQGGGKYAFGGMGVGIFRNFDDRWNLGFSVRYLGQTSFNTFPEQRIVPLTADIRVKVNSTANGRFATLLGANIGYNFNVGGRQFDSGLNTHVRVRDGLFFNPSIAFRVNIFRNFGAMLDLGYQLTSGNIFNVETGELLDKRTWHNAVARGSIFF